MTKSYLSIVLVAALVLQGFTPAFAKGKTVAAGTEKFKAKVAEIGVGEKAKVSLGTRGNTKEIKGYIGEAGSDSFVIVDRKSGEKMTIAYSDVTYLSGPTPKRAWIWFTVGVSVVVLFVVTGIYYSGA